MVAEPSARRKGIGSEVNFHLSRKAFNIENDSHDTVPHVWDRVLPLSWGILGSEAVQRMIKYAHREIRVNIIEAKISFGNLASRAMFQSLGFQITSESSIFKEVTFTLDLTTNPPDWFKQLSEPTQTPYPFE